MIGTVLVIAIERKVKGLIVIVMTGILLMIVIEVKMERELGKSINCKR